MGTSRRAHGRFAPTSAHLDTPLAVVDSISENFPSPPYTAPKHQQQRVNNASRVSQSRALGECPGPPPRYWYVGTSSSSPALAARPAPSLSADASMQPLSSLAQPVDAPRVSQNHARFRRMLLHPRLVLPQPCAPRPSLTSAQHRHAAAA